MFKHSKLLVLLTVKGRIHFYKGFTSFSKHLDISEFGYIWNILHEDLQMFLIKKSVKGKQILVFLWCPEMNLRILCNLRDRWRKKINRRRNIEGKNL